MGRAGLTSVGRKNPNLYFEMRTCHMLRGRKGEGTGNEKEKQMGGRKAP